MRNSFILFSIVIAFLGAMLSCNGQVKSASDLKPSDFKNQIEKPGAQIIDVRTPQEFQSGHILGSVNIDWYDPAFKSKVSSLDKAKPVYVYCAVGGRSGQAKTMLEGLGFTNVNNLSGGIEAWKKMNLPLEK